jgi:hypothetical protein
MSDPSQEVATLEQEIEDIRRGLDDIVGELDRRRHELMDWRLQLRRHRTGVLLIAGVVLVSVAGLVGLRVRRHRLRERPVSKVRRLRHAVARMIDDPDSVARPTPKVGRRILAAAGSAAASALGKRMIG